MIDIHAVVREDLERQVQHTLGYRVLEWSALSGGGNNRLFRLETDGPALVAKIYRRSAWLDDLFRRSGGDALTREFGVLSLLHQHDIRDAPRPYVRSDIHSYGVYSYEPGATRDPSELHTDEIRALAAFASALHSLSPDEAGDDLPPALDAGFSLAEHIATIRERLKWPTQHTTEPPSGEATDDALRSLLAEKDIPAEVERLIAAATVGLSPEEITTPLPRSSWRLTSGDFCVFNLLVADKRVTVVDWEWAGWDDPAKLVMGFVAHAGSEGLSPALADTFVETYAIARGLFPAERNRFQRVALLLEAFWLAALPWALMPETIAARRFAVADFDEQAHVAGITTRVRNRLARTSMMYPQL
ncbi:MAG TPA: aminoglycoside phosphotransferase family protein [Chloroflexota bacterium]|nr:aminoglycoside phosphotransferase family protein [Chloroflexota bacterium]